MNAVGRANELLTQSGSKRPDRDEIKEFYNEGVSVSVHPDPEHL